MKKMLTTRGYLRAILLSALMAFAIECCVNAEEVHDAFIAGRNLRQTTTASIKSSTDGFLKVPQGISKIVGMVCRAFAG
jgi:hypothetical protein